MIQTIPDYSCIFQRIPDHSRVFQTIPDYSRLFQSIPDWFRVFQTVPGYFRLFQTILDCSRQFQVFVEKRHHRLSETSSNILCFGEVSTGGRFGWTVVVVGHWTQYRRHFFGFATSATGHTGLPRFRTAIYFNRLRLCYFVIATSRVNK